MAPFDTTDITKQGDGSTKLFPADSLPFEFTDAELRSFGFLRWYSPPHFFLCSGVLISPEHVLTAAHCALMAKYGGVPFDATKYYAGTLAEPHNLARMASLGGPPPVVVGQDVAVTKLTDTVADFTPIPITTDPAVGEEVVIVGYGPLSDRPEDPTVGAIPVRFLGTARVLVVKAGEIYMEETRGTVLYPGDSGGAVVAGPAESKHLVGVMSGMTGDEATTATYRQALGLPPGRRLIMAPAVSTLTHNIGQLIDKIETDTSPETILTPTPTKRSVLPLVLGGIGIGIVGLYFLLKE